MLTYNNYYDAIDEIKSFLHMDLIGPITEDEIIENIEPLSYYTMGIVWPKSTKNERDTEKLSLFDIYNSDIEDDINLANDVISDANIYEPCGMGVSVMLPANATSLNVDFAFAKYVLHKTEKNKTYERKPYNLTTTFLVPNICKFILCTENNNFKNIGIEISLCVRKIMDDGRKLVTVSVSNILVASSDKKLKNEYALFQCKLSLRSEIGFLPIHQNKHFENNIDDQITAMQYRNVLNYANGHGCSVFYEKSNFVTHICSDFLPYERVFLMKSVTLKQNDLLKLNYWNTADRDDACNKLLLFINEYESWYKSLDTHNISGYKNAINTVFGRIDTCIKRLKDGVRVLKTNDAAYQSFKLMNEAMLLQRINSKNLSNNEINNIEWYPFQLAYILQVVPDITEPNSKFRDVVDLLWFPTGGGKTEAYLGVSAFVIFYRRISQKLISDGVTIIMRYTLRLLTIQQFERAAALVCSCEHLRKQNNISGGEISIGLWIGSTMTPNHINGYGGATEILKDLKENPNKILNESNPVQITVCPWCGTSIDLDGYEIFKNKGLVIRCNNNPACEFHNALPIYVVDDDIYNNRPTILLSTIDKFARLAWQIESKSIFGDKPPELIIQDELHLISGPLGSLAGIYEVGVEYLCCANGKYPKVIASTATVKNAIEQIKNIYNKETFQFPPSGLNFDDSFFAVLADDKERPARTYIGLCETGGTLSDLTIRVYANLMFLKALFIKQQKPEDLIDQFSTIVGYFNAIRDLGGTDNIISDRVYSYIKTLINIKFKSYANNVSLTLSDIKTRLHDELTSRKNAKEIKETLTNLSIKYTDNGYYSYVLASNMLSVGIDIDRLGLMTVYNQPKSNAEYIQATSRVGRKNPGLVLVMYNGSRTRDKSHYEQFGFYHKAFYQYVEATSVTPFSARAMEKALHCVFIIMLRLTEPNLGANEYAANFRVNDESVKKVMSFILDRVKNIHKYNYDMAYNWLCSIATEWERMALENPDTLVYNSTSNGNYSLLISGEQEENYEFPPTLNSLRNVEPSSNVFVQERI